MSRIGWLDASSGISGDMLLGACVDAGVPIGVLQSQIDRLGLPECITLVAEQVTRAGIGATRVLVNTAEGQHNRTLGDVLLLLDSLDAEIREKASAAFRTLAAAEAQVHRIPIDAVHFHEVGALDSIADVVGAAAAMRWLDLDGLICSPIALGGGRANTHHGSIPIPAPAVMELLAGAGVPAHGGPVERELATPTGVALAITFADAFGPMPMLAPARVGAGAGSWDPDGYANVVRLVIGDAADERPEITWADVDHAIVLEANVDDLDPRLWPTVIAALMDAGAADAWLTPIVMKKGRPAHTISVLAAPDLTEKLARVLLTQSSSIGLRRRSVDKVALPRQTVTIDIDGSPIRVKIARLDDDVVNVSAEYDDVVNVAVNSGRPVKQVLDDAMRAARTLWNN